MSPVPPLHRNLDRRGLFAAGGALGGAALLSACSSDGEAEASGDTEGSQPWTFTDDRDRTVELDAAPSTVVAFTGLAAAMYDYGVEITTVFGPTTTESGEPDLQAGRMPVGELTVLGNVWGEFDLERYVAAEPDLMASHFHEGFDELWYVPEEVGDEVEQVAPTIGIATGDRPLEEVLTRHVELAAALGADMDSEVVAAGRDRYEAAVEAVREAAADNPVRLIACNASPEALYVGNPQAFDVLAKCAELGVDLVMPDNPEDGGYWETLAWENADRYQGDAILLDQRTGNLKLETLAEEPTWASLPAVEAGQVTPWNPEPVYSHVGVAEILESIAEALSGAEPVVSG
ncbi:ABC transporter substrate-binding protein [Glycomyces xiaoerkulensis]|uniref:ABC transporter substrate-binding protein n=1 Tax=Glycomyces xiaoerkulensis TaxID=2038139 RepID=UPI000C26151D|nr:ABC transporter substrate-binding protein [Glycomyces xiaoerkulensis]